MSEKKKFNRTPYLVIGLVVIVAVLAAVIFLGNRPEKTDFQKQEGSEFMSIETAYGTLEYPDARKDNLVIREDDGENKEEPEKVEFMYTGNDEEVVLFTVYYNQDKGIPLGQYKDTKTTVSVELSDLEEIKDWDQEKQDLVCEMQEGVNDMIAGLHEDDNFVPAE